MKKIQESPRKDPGQTIVEYALVLALVVIVAIVALVLLGGRTSNTLENIATSWGLLDTEPEEPELAVHVSGIDMSVQGGGMITVTGIVTVRDQDGAPVRGATVSASWLLSGTFVESDSDGTDGQGRARLRYRSDELEEGDVVKLAVTNVAASGYDYDSGSNVESEDEIVVP